MADTKTATSTISIGVKSVFATERAPGISMRTSSANNRSAG
jgi:hypothetical protein